MNFSKYFPKETSYEYDKLHVLLLQELGVKKGNRKFRHSCASGVFDGYWYSFITMLTVGYGDKVRSTQSDKFFMCYNLVKSAYLCNKCESVALRFKFY